MNAIPLVRNDFRIDKSMNRVTPGEPFGSKASAMGGAVGGSASENQLRQEVNTSIVALKREAFSLETLLAQAAQELISLNNRISALEGDYVKKSDVTDTVESGNSNPVSSQGVKSAIDALDVSQVGGSGKYISEISETDGKISAVASDIATSVASGNSNPVTSGAVYNVTPWKVLSYNTEYEIGVCFHRKLYTMIGYTSFSNGQGLDIELPINSSDVVACWIDISGTYIMGGYDGTRQPWFVGSASQFFATPEYGKIHLKITLNHIGGTLYYKVLYTKEYVD